MSLEATAVQPTTFRPAKPLLGKDEFTLENLHQHLQTAIYVEMSTIPLYLYAFYSIDRSNKPGKKARQLISGVFQEEMLHLALASNILYAIGKAPKLYSPETIPVFPTKILYTPITMNLRDGRQEHMDTFIAIEAPARPVVVDAENDVLPDYHSIGEFYGVIQRELVTHQASIHKGTNQIRPEDKIWHDAGLVVISNLENANTALDTIVTQGEGANEGSHHRKFLALRELNPKWDALPVVENPQTETTYHDKVFYEVSRTFDAVYCFLLLNIERLYQVSGGPREICNNNIRFIMESGVLSNIADFLVDQSFDENTVAAPCFNYYALDTEDPLGSLKKEIAAAVARYEGQDAKQKELKGIQKSIDNLAQLPAPNA